MNWTRGRIIGRGSTATVSVATPLRSGQVLAVKSIELSHSQFLKREQMILSTLNCPQIIAYKGYDITSEHGRLMFNLFMEYAPGGSIVDAMDADGGCFDEAMVRSYTREILLGLEYLHSNGVVHCDIKCHNILVTDEGIKIADFGFARHVGEVSGANLAGTPIFMAPEVACGEQQGFPADVWAVGCMVIQMLTGKAPWPDVSDPVAALYRIMSSNDVPEIPRFMSEQGKDFLRRCLIRSPEERWSISELLKHPFLLHEKKFPLKQNSRSDSDTPTSILEQRLWDSVNELETIQTLTLEKISKTRLKRIQQLDDGNGKPNWEWDEDWVTVRSNDMEETERRDCFLESKLLCSFKFIAIKESDGNGVDNQDCFSICIRDLPMVTVCLRTVTLETIKYVNNEKLCINISFMGLGVIFFHMLCSETQFKNLVKTYTTFSSVSSLVLNVRKVLISSVMLLKSSNSIPLYFD